MLLREAGPVSPAFHESDVTVCIELTDFTATSATCARRIVRLLPVTSARAQELIMISRATCPTCGAAFQISDDQLGKTIACTKCHSMFQLLAPASTTTTGLPRKQLRLGGWLFGGLVAVIALAAGLAAGAVIGIRWLKPADPSKAAEMTATPGDVTASSPTSRHEEQHQQEGAAAQSGPKPPPTSTTAPHDSPPPTNAQGAPAQAPLPMVWSDLLSDKNTLVNLQADFPDSADASQRLARLREAYPAATPELVHRLYQITDNSVLPQHAVKGQNFTYQLPKLDGAQYELVTNAANGLSLSRDGVISWPTSLNMGAGAYELRFGLRPGPIVRTIKIELAEDPTSTLALPHIGGWVMLPDGVTLICSLPDQAQLVYIDTAASKELKRVGLAFKPELLTVQGKRLYASVQNASVVHVLNLETGENQKEITVAGGGITDMVCHPDHGLVFIARPNSDRIAYIDPETYATGITQAPVSVVGVNPMIANVYPAVDPVRSDILYVAYQNNLRRVMNFPNQTPNDTVLVKYLVGGRSLQEVGMNQGVAQHGYVVRVTRDGKKVAVSGGAGYFSGGGLSGYKADLVGLFAADKLTSVAGVVNCGAHPSDLAFHPVLDLGVVEQESDPYAVRTGHRRYEQITPDQHLHLFNTSSLVEIANITLAGSPFTPEQAGRLLTFGARGTKLLYYDRAQGCLRSFPLTLSDADKAALAKAYAPKGK
jgi:predicted Zn finger-like uncharacterized protein